MNTEQISDLRRLAEIQREQDNLMVAELMKQEHLDEDGYPTEAALVAIELWNFQDCKGWFAFINSLWAHKSWGWCEGDKPDERNTDKTKYQYDISTAGWSGNESLIAAMEKNFILWSTTWVQSRRGGHFIFEDNEYGE